MVVVCSRVPQGFWCYEGLVGSLPGFFWGRCLTRAELVAMGVTWTCRRQGPGRQSPASAGLAGFPEGQKGASPSLEARPVGARL